MRRILALLLSALLLITLAGCYNLDTGDYIAPTPVVTPTPKPTPTPAPLPTTSDGSLETPKDPLAIQRIEYGYENGAVTESIIEYVPPYALPEKVFQIGDVVERKDVTEIDGEMRDLPFSYKVSGITITQDPADIKDMILGKERPIFEAFYDPDDPGGERLNKHLYYLIMDITITNLSDAEVVKYLGGRFWGMNEYQAIIYPCGVVIDPDTGEAFSDFYVRAEITDMNKSQHPNSNSFSKYTFQPNEVLDIRFLTVANDKAITDYDLCFVPGIKEGDPNIADDFIIIHKRSALP